MIEDSALDSGKYVAGLDANQGAITFQNVTVDQAGEYGADHRPAQKG